MPSLAAVVSQLATYRWLLVFVCAASCSLEWFARIEAGDKTSSDKEATERKEPRTIGDVVSVAGLQSYPVIGIGIVVGLPDTGSDPIPGPDRSALLLEMQKRGIKQPEEILRSPTTALVRLRARIPPAVRSCKSAGCWCRDKKLKRNESENQPIRLHKGDTFDVEVEAPNRDATTSLKGGWLLEAWLQESAEVAGAGGMSGHVMARAEGPVLVTGGLDGQPAGRAELCRGRVLGGAIAQEDRNLALVTESERAGRWSLQVASRINERFPGKSRDGKPVAEAKTGQQILLKVPTRYHENIARYLEVLRFMPLSQSGGQEVERMAWWGGDLLDPAQARVAALKLEGIGYRAVETLKKGLSSSNAVVRFFAAEALAYLDEAASAEPLAKLAGEIPEFRAHALTALSALDEPIAPLMLRDLLRDSNSVELRYGAFRALRALDPESPIIPGRVLADQVYLHEVPSNGKMVIHVSSRDRPEIVLFGERLQFQTPLSLKIGNNIVLTAPAGATKLQMSRFDPGQPVGQQFCATDITDVIAKAMDMRATYPDIVGMLVQADKQHNLPGRLEMDALPDPRLLISRLQGATESSEKPPENVAMPNLLGWTEPRKRGSKDRAENSDDLAEDDSDERERKYLTKPTFWDRLFRRTAN